MKSSAQQAGVILSGIGLSTAQSSSEISSSIKRIEKAVMLTAFKVPQELMKEYENIEPPESLKSIRLELRVNSICDECGTNIVRNSDGDERCGCFFERRDPRGP